MNEMKAIALALGRELKENVDVIGEGDGSALMLLPRPTWRPVYLATLLGGRLVRVQGGTEYQTVAILGNGRGAAVDSLAEFVRGRAISRDEALQDLTTDAFPSDSDISWLRPRPLWMGDA